MKGQKQPYLTAWLNGGQDKNKCLVRGYTVVEVMVFLAISGMMFIIAASFISGKQGKSEFRQGMNAINSQILQVISDVSNGYYPHSSNFFCSATAPGKPVLVPTTPKEQGANQGCVFLGKVMQFQVSSRAGIDKTAYNIFTVIGRQFAAGTSNPPANFSQSNPIAAYSGVNLTENKTLEWRLEVTKMYEDKGATQPLVSAVGFFSSFSGLTTQSGSQTVNVAAIPAITQGQTDSIAAGNIGAAPTLITLDTPGNPNPKIVICFQSSSVAQYGSLTIGGDTSNGTTGQRLNTSIQISNSTIAGC